jgi:hypothetical protein
MSDESTDTAATDELVAELEAMREKQKQLLAETKKAKAALKAYANIDPDEYKTLLDERETREVEAAKQAGEFDKIKAKYDAQLEKLQALYADEQRRNQRAHIVAETNRAIAQHGGNPKLLEPVLLGTLTCETDGDTYSVFAEVDGAKVSADDYVAHLKADKDFAGAFPGAGVLGSGAQPSTGVTADLPIPENIEIIN